jgi:hypothetical protein
MHTPMHWRTERGRYFQAHPLHATFSLTEHAASRAGCTGARLVRKVIRRFDPPAWIAARMTRWLVTAACGREMLFFRTGL